MLEQVLETRKFDGLNNAEDAKQTPFTAFYKMSNFNFPDTGILGVDKILAPSQVKHLDATHAIDGIFEYRYLSIGGSLTTEQIGVSNGTIYKNCLALSPTPLKTGLTAGICTFATYQDKLFIANGKNYVNVYWGSLGVVSEMGAPAAVATATSGNVNVGAHYYAMTYVTAAGEEIIGSVSNTVTIVSTGKTVTLSLPLGYEGTLNRNIYRTVAGGTQLKLLANINDNTTLTYTDNTLDNGLGGNISSTLNNELPKPYFLAVAGQSLYGCVVDKYPTQVFKTDTNLEVWDLANYIDVANYGDDNTAIVGIGLDFGKITVGTGKQCYFIEPSDTVIGVMTVKPTRANVGFKSGYTVKSIPAWGSFPGGLMFVSTQNDVRLLTGNVDLPVVTVIGNVTTQNFAQNIRGSLNTALASYSNITSEFYKNKYHLVIDGIKYIFDIRAQGWTYNNIITSNYHSQPRVFGLLGTGLYNGQPDGWIELEYQNVQYRGEDLVAYIESPQVVVSSKYKFIEKVKWWLKANTQANVNFQVITDSNDYYPIVGSFVLTGGAFDPSYYNATYFDTSSGEMDYKVLNIHSPARWFKYRLTCSAGFVSLQGVEVFGTALTDKKAQ